MYKNVKILFVCPYFSSFIQQDLDLLKKHFDVRIGHYTGLMSIPKILKGVLWSDLTFSWFADTHAFWAVLLSKIFKKKSIVVVGGFEVAKVPEINYGLMRSPLSTRRVKYVLENADKILTVDDSLKTDAIGNTGVNGKNILTVPTGYDSSKWKCDGKKENLVITVGYVNWSVVKRKGFETFVKSAEYVPNTKFALIGKHIDSSIDYLNSISPSNVEFTGFVSDNELLEWYRKAKVYCQLSRYEGLPNALCETMLCECVPVGTRYCGIPTAIGDTGFYVPYGDPETTAEAIEKALKSDNGKTVRERVKKMFPFEKREKKLKQIIYSLTDKVL